MIKCKKIRTIRMIRIFLLCKYMGLKIRSLWCSWERNHVTDVLHTRHEEHQTLESKTESSVRA